STPSSGSRSAFLETSIGQAILILAEQLANPGASLFQPDIVQGCVQMLNGAMQVALGDKGGRGKVEEDGCEVLYGRAGLLYAILYLRSAAGGSSGNSLAKTVEPLISDQVIQALVDDIIKRGKTGATYYQGDLSGKDKERAPKLMWMWHGKRYLGGAHGVAGILQILLSAPTEIIQPHLPVIYDTVGWLISLQDHEGNWPHKASTRPTKQVTEDLVQWCHGAPAVLILLSTLIKRASALHTPSSLLTAAKSALQRGAALVYERGLLRKGVGLCHGVAGSVYALLAASDVLDAESSEPMQLQRAVYLAVQATQWDDLVRKAEMQLPDRPYSLYEGLAGMCCAWGALIAKL
ncbi:hypothetical protein GLOTRDRAFT_22498, partial [Gloeophyllum trabeum ATCC 11539]